MFSAGPLVRFHPKDFLAKPLAIGTLHFQNVSPTDVSVSDEQDVGGPRRNLDYVSHVADGAVPDDHREDGFQLRPAKLRRGERGPGRRGEDRPAALAPPSLNALPFPEPHGFERPARRAASLIQNKKNSFRKGVGVAAPERNHRQTISSRQPRGPRIIWQGHNAAGGKESSFPSTIL